MNQWEPWTEDQDDALRKLCATGKGSARSLGRQIGKSKSAVIGRADRLGLRLPGSTPETRAAGAARAGEDRSQPAEFKRVRGDWGGLVVETWDERKARRAIERALNDNHLPETDRWAAEFAFETPGSLRAALGILAGRLNDPALLRHVADRLEALNRATKNAVVPSAPKGVPSNPVSAPYTAPAAG